jgi:hypothetical protein
MGIMNSELLKTGVDIANKFLEILNKATSGINGFAGSITKIMSILGIFKMGMKIFQKFRQPLVKFFADVVAEAKKGGEEAGKAFDEGSRSSLKKASDTAKGQPDNQPNQGKPPMTFTEAAKKTFTKEGQKEAWKGIGAGAMRVTGVSDFKQGLSKAFTGAKKARAVLEEERFKGKTREDLQTKV